MKRTVLILLVLLIASVGSAATIQWTAVPDTDKYTVEGYIVHYRFIGNTQWSEYATPDTSVTNMEKVFRLIPTETYEFAVSAYTSDGDEGPLHEPVPYQYIQTKAPVILEVGGVVITVEENK